MINTAETVRDLEVPEGRRLLHEFYHDRRVKNTFELKTLIQCWRFCVKAVDHQTRGGQRVQFEASLGFKLGTRVFFEEIVWRYYYSTIQGMVYAGAVLLLASIGLYLGGFPLWIVIAAFCIEGVLLLTYSVATAFTPPEEPTGTAMLNSFDSPLMSLNTTVREMSSAVSDLFRLVSQADIRQDVLITRLSESLSRAGTENTRAQLEKLDQIHGALKRLSDELALHSRNSAAGHQELLSETRSLVASLRETAANNGRNDSASFANRNNPSDPGADDPAPEITGR